eukprot:UN03050
MIGRSNKLNYDQHCDTYVFETELRKCLSEEHNLTKVFNAMNTIFTDTIIIPLLYDLMVFILLIRYLIVYTQSGMTEFEYVYSIMLCVLIVVAVCCSSAILCTKNYSILLQKIKLCVNIFISLLNFMQGVAMYVISHTYVQNIYQLIIIIY